MPRGGSRVGAGRPKGGSRAPEGEKSLIAIKENKLPLEYMLAVMNDPSADEGRRDRMAVAAAPYVHGKPGEKGKKEEKAGRAAEAARGRFAPPPEATIN